MKKINALIVIYNKSLADSPTIKSLNLSADVSVWIADNSTQDYGNRVYAEGQGYTYIDMGGNMGLSKAYNRVISMLDKTDGLICLFDDDTTVDRQYFVTLTAAAETRPDIDLFAPVVLDNEGILSPCMITGASCRRIKSIDELPEQGVSAINSGLAIRLRVFKNYLFDEGQFLDYIDHAFVRDVTSNQLSRICIMSKLELRQRFSGNDKQDRAAAIVRYQIFRRDFTYYCKKSGIPWIRLNIVLAKRRIKLLIRHGIVWVI